ncbi:helix-turn-helix transcriptional regulator (plasmid) [Acinetobacter soli]|uniref:AraC family transcriptional regulator n=1 Tax=Acinetobacter bereziniae TaxID=106648 RepID=UPI0027DB4A1C|nr:helix-turn-helix transcriptional regulator [Acinetobacter soli]WEH90964.1 helix-turn-helix transcriptional regulator [Acinetobacter soli]WEH99307.1 helix-turn-helix transcriptional regulator [Acinetobacter soli]WEI02357.1 helix-turn-helix transcriptional regulator [Acinetobacter soli]
MPEISDSFKQAKQWSFDDSKDLGPVIAMHVETGDEVDEIPFHQHVHGQLIMSLKGAITCETPNSVWIVPPKCGVWIPSQLPHSIRTTTNTKACYLFIDPKFGEMSERCCTIKLTSLVQELILHLASVSSSYAVDSANWRKAVVLVEELSVMPIEELYLPTSDEPHINLLTKLISDHPDDRRTLSEWASTLAVSERTLMRIFRKETGLSFRQWRQQLHLIIAIRQLSEGNSVQRVANNLGYDSVNAFITMFKKLVGMPPTKYFSRTYHKVD